MDRQPGILARGPWSAAEVQSRWREDAYEPDAGKVAAADAAIAALRDRGSPSHDGVAARMTGFHQTPGGGLVIELQPMRWALRLVDDDASDSLAALCLTRSHDGRWLAGRRAAWLSTWAGRWALGAGGAVDLGESPMDTLHRELREEWSVEADRMTAEALVRLPHHLIMFVGVAWLPADAEIVPDHEHDQWAWWPPDPKTWPAEASEPLRHMATLLAAA